MSLAHPGPWLTLILAAGPRSGGTLVSLLASSTDITLRSEPGH